jgi:prepilin-type N-terminal cleavage/methylation domain-containing protein
VNRKFQIVSDAGGVPDRNPPPRRSAFTLIEVMVVLVLLSLIVLVLMAVFNSTQAAFRASITQIDVLEGGRAVMELATGDLRAMSPSMGPATNLFVEVENEANPLVQSLIGSSNFRTNVIESVFILSRQNQTWTGVGYAVDTASTNAFNPLYRFSMSTNVSAVDGPQALFNLFYNNIPLNNPPPSSPPWSHLLDGVVEFQVRAYDPNGVVLTNGYAGSPAAYVNNAQFYAPVLGEVGFYMYSNALPASVEIEMATLEDHILQTAATWPNNSPSQFNYLAQQAGKVHVFRQRVTLPNVDPSVYQ